jgi:creatinine amidohydrolase
MAFPGTVSLQPSTFHAVCRDYCVSLARHGFRKTCFLPSHGGNFRPLQEVLTELNSACGPECTVVAYTDLLEVLECWRRVVEQEVGLGARVGGHADIAESSVMLVLHPRLVRQGEAECGYLPELAESVVDRIISEGFDSVSPNGILGDARGMTQPIGERCIAELADLMAAAFRE